MKKTLTLALCATALIACEKKEYCSNDPNAAPDASTCYAVQDYGRTYKHFFQPKNAWVGDPMPFYDNGKFISFTYTTNVQHLQLSTLGIVLPLLIW